MKDISSLHVRTYRRTYVGEVPKVRTRIAGGGLGERPVLVAVGAGESHWFADIQAPYRGENFEVMTHARGAQALTAPGSPFNHPQGHRLWCKTLDSNKMVPLQFELHERHYRNPDHIIESKGAFGPKIARALPNRPNDDNDPSGDENDNQPDQHNNERYNPDDDIDDAPDSDDDGNGSARPRTLTPASSSSSNDNTHTRQSQASPQRPGNLFQGAGYQATPNDLADPSLVDEIEDDDGFSCAETDEAVRRSLNPSQQGRPIKTEDPDHAMFFPETATRVTPGPSGSNSYANPVRARPSATPILPPVSAWGALINAQSSSSSSSNIFNESPSKKRKPSTSNSEPTFSTFRRPSLPPTSVSQPPSSNVYNSNRARSILPTRPRGDTPTALRARAAENRRRSNSQVSSSSLVDGSINRARSSSSNSFQGPGHRLGGSGPSFGGGRY